MSWQGLVFVILLIGAGIASWLLGGGSGVEPRGVAEPPPPDARYYFEGVTVLETGADGAAIYQVAAESAVQSAADQSVTLRQVDLAFESTDAHSWMLAADRALIPPDGRIIQLSGHVVLRNEQEAPTVVETNSLTVDPGRQLAMTSDEVRVSMGPHTLIGVGMQARLDTQQLKLESGVRGSFTP
ncbi:hypothetical protein BH24PSE2_BH24PSE2_06120 [soil metagenome]